MTSNYYSHVKGQIQFLLVFALRIIWHQSDIRVIDDLELCISRFFQCRVVRRPSVNFSLKRLITQARSFLRKVPMYCKNVDLVESSKRSFIKVKFGSFFTWRQFSQKLLDIFFSILAWTKLPKEATNGLPKDGYNWIAIKRHLWKVRKRANLYILLLFGNFFKNCQR